MSQNDSSFTVKHTKHNKASKRKCRFNISQGTYHRLVGQWCESLAATIRVGNETQNEELNKHEKIQPIKYFLCDILCILIFIFFKIKKYKNQFESKKDLSIAHLKSIKYLIIIIFLTSLPKRNSKYILYMDLLKYSPSLKSKLKVILVLI